MSKNSSGHKQNVESFGELIANVSSFSNYNPARPDLSIENLTQVQTSGETVLQNVIDAENAQKNTQAARLQVFDNFEKKFVTPSINAFRICGVSEQTIKQAEALVREIRGKRASEKLSDEELAAAKAEGNEITQNTKHNASFERITDNFGKYVSFVGTLPEYNPNETAIALAALTEELEAMKEVNKTVVVAEVALERARNARTEVLYSDKTGLCDLAADVKLYVKSAYGADSVQYKVISGIPFRKNLK